MEDKILSIIVPSYNMEVYLPKCLGSLVIDDKELLQKLDVIVVNDGSRDRTSEIAHEFESRYPDVFRVVDKPNGHYGSCINAALPIVKGTYVKVLDADDYFDSQILGRYLSFLRNIMRDGHSPDLILSGYINESLDETLLSKCIPSYQEGKVHIIDSLDDCSLCIHTVMTFKTNLFAGINYRQTEGICYTDVEWVMFPLAGCRDYTCFPHALYHYLVGRDGQSMERAQLSKNLWMWEKVGLGLVRGVPKVLSGATDAHRQFVMRNVGNVFVNLYKMCICGYGRGSYDDQLRALDDRLGKEAPEVFMYITKACVYSSVVPYNFVVDWRRRSCLLRLRLVVARIKTAVVNRWHALSQK